MLLPHVFLNYARRLKIYASSISLGFDVKEMHRNFSLFAPRKGEYTLVTLPRIVTPYRDSVDETRARVTYQKLVTR